MFKILLLNPRLWLTICRVKWNKNKRNSRCLRKKNIYISGASHNRDNCLSHSEVRILPNNDEGDLEVNIWISLLFLMYSTIENFLTNLLKPTSQPIHEINLHSQFFYKAYVWCSNHAECFSSKDQIKIIATQPETHSRSSQIYQC